MHLTRRDALRAIAVSPLLAAGGCCPSQYPRSVISDGRIPAIEVEPILAPRRWTGRAGSAPAVIDVHAHFFNASDVPVRGFIADCIGHNAPALVQPLLRALAALAEKIAERAPTAVDELDALLKLEADARRPGVDAARVADDWLSRQRALTAQRLVEIVRGSDFERRYLEMNPTTTRTRVIGIDENEVLDVVTGARQRDAARAPSGLQDARAAGARAKLEFLFYMLAPRAENLRAYIEAYAGESDPAGVDTVLGALVDFDYWLDCPPRSSHDDQIALHKHLARLHGGFMRPVVAYNPWTDIEQRGAGLDRVLNAWASGMFAGVKIYPPTGFMAAGNATAKVKTGKRRPDLSQLDGVLETFFNTCAERQIPVLAHAAHSNGRDDVHDEFSAPTVWDRLVCRMATRPRAPILSFGHFGGDNTSTDWTQQFANLIRSQPSARLFADLGYWDTLLCRDSTGCQAGRNRLKEALEVRISDSETLADRVMFASDWLMLSQVTGWREYPAQVKDAVASVAPAAVDRIMGGNATRCFLIPPRA